MQSAVIATAIPSDCLSVRPSHAGTLSTRMKIGSCGLHCEVAKNTLVFWYQQWLGRRPLRPKICAPPAEKRRLWPISAYNVSTVRAIEKVQLSRIESRSRAFQRAIDEVRTLPLSPSVGGSKSKFVIFVNKNKFKSNKLCYKVAFCENFQRHCCSRTIPLSNGVYMLAINVTVEPNI